LGFGAGPVDDVMGPRRRKAVIAFQRACRPLLVDGIPGPKTQAKFRKVCGY
jgi:peptidoglycan hydrolase-like protein with peptidoglycan-binding domain